MLLLHTKDQVYRNPLASFTNCLCR